MLPRHALRFTLLALVVALGACVPSPEEVAAQTSADTRSLVREALETGQLTNSWSSVDQVFVNTGAATSAFARPHMPEVTAMDSSLDVVSKYADRIFVDGNVVDRPLGAVVFGLSGTLLCADPLGKAPTSLECIQNTDKMMLRLKVSGSLDFTLQVGPEHLEPVVFKVHGRQSLSVEVDLGASEKAVAFVNGALGHASPTSGATLVSSGRFEVKLQRNGDHDFTLSYSTLSAVKGTYTDVLGKVRTWSSEARAPFASVRVEGLAHKLTALLDEGAMEGNGLSTDFGYGFASSSTRGADGGVTYTSTALPVVPMSFVLGGLSAQLNLEEGKNPTLTRVGLGDRQSLVTYDGKKLLAVDLNASMGRHFNLAMTPVGPGMRLDFTPGVEVVVYTGFAALPAATRPDSNSLDTTYTFSFKSPSGPASLQVTPALGAAKGSTRVLAGVLRLSSTQPGQSPREYSSGTCLTSRTDSSTTRHPVLDVFASTVCP